jgi:nucleoside-diphosphate-sugar epimerase
MSRVVVIGATGHIGSYLVPRLVRGGHEVMAMSRGTRGPYHALHEALTWLVANGQADVGGQQF